MSLPFRGLWDNDQRLAVLCAGLGAALGLVQAAAAALGHSMNPDGISYIELGEAWLRGDWRAALNAYWSPLYSWLLGLALVVGQPSPRWEFPLVHAVNFLVYLGALAAFAFFWGELVQRRLGDRAGGVTFSRPAWVVLGFALFTWSAFNLIEIWSVNPDMLASVFVYLAAGLLLRVDQARGRRAFALLGLALGLGYLAKAALLPLALVFLAAGLVATRDLRGTALAVLVFLLVVTPLVVALSWREGRPTFGASGWLNYAWYVNGVPQFHWRGEEPESGTPLHPTRRLRRAPPVYEFASPVPGTYPPWYDPAYWYAGIRPRFDPGAQIRVVWRSATRYYGWIVRSLGGLAATLLLLYAMSVRRPGALRDLARWWILIIPALAGLAMYGLVLVEGRYVGAFLVLLWGALLAGVRLPHSAWTTRLGSAASLVILLAVLADIGALALRNAGAFLGLEGAGDPVTVEIATPEGGAGPPWEVARGLREMGLAEGTHLGYIGRAVDDLGWARLARVRIVAETYEWPTTTFWSDPAEERRALRALVEAGAAVIVAADVPRGATYDWRRIGNTSHFLLDSTGISAAAKRSRTSPEPARVRRESS